MHKFNLIVALGCCALLLDTVGLAAARQHGDGKARRHKKARRHDLAEVPRLDLSKVEQEAVEEEMDWSKGATLKSARALTLLKDDINIKRTTGSGTLGLHSRSKRDPKDDYHTYLSASPPLDGRVLLMMFFCLIIGITTVQFMEHSIENGYLRVYGWNVAQPNRNKIFNHEVTLGSFFMMLVMDLTLRIAQWWKVYRLRSEYHCNDASAMPCDEAYDELLPLWRSNTLQSFLEAQKTNRVPLSTLVNDEVMDRDELEVNWAVSDVDMPDDGVRMTPRDKWQALKQTRKRSIYVENDDGTYRDVPMTQRQWLSPTLDQLLPDYLRVLVRFFYVDGPSQKTIKSSLGMDVPIDDERDLLDQVYLYRYNAFMLRKADHRLQVEENQDTHSIVELVGEEHVGMVTVNTQKLQQMRIDYQQALQRMQLQLGKSLKGCWFNFKARKQAVDASEKAQIIMDKAHSWNSLFLILLALTPTLSNFKGASQLCPSLNTNTGTVKQGVNRHGPPTKTDNSSYGSSFVNWIDMDYNTRGYNPIHMFPGSRAIGGVTSGGDLPLPMIPHALTWDCSNDGRSLVAVGASCSLVCERGYTSILGQTVCYDLGGAGYEFSHLMPVDGLIQASHPLDTPSCCVSDKGAATLSSSSATRLTQSGELEVRWNATERFAHSCGAAPQISLQACKLVAGQDPREVEDARCDDACDGVVTEKATCAKSDSKSLAHPDWPEYEKLVPTQIVPIEFERLNNRTATVVQRGELIGSVSVPDDPSAATAATGTVLVYRMSVIGTTAFGTNRSGVVAGPWRRVT